MKAQARPKTATSSIQAQPLCFHSSGLELELENALDKAHILPCLEIIYLSLVILKKKKNVSIGQLCISFKLKGVLN